MPSFGNLGNQDETLNYTYHTKTVIVNDKIISVLHYSFFFMCVYIYIIWGVCMYTNLSLADSNCLVKFFWMLLDMVEYIL